MGTVDAILPCQAILDGDGSVYLLVVPRLETCMHHDQALEMLYNFSPSKPRGIRAVPRSTQYTHEQDRISSSDWESIDSQALVSTQGG